MNNSIIFNKINIPSSQNNRNKLFRNNSLNNIHNDSSKNNLYPINIMKYNDLQINNSNSMPIFKKIFPNNNLFYNDFKINNIYNFKNIKIKSKLFNNKKLLSNYDLNRQSSLNYCDASTNTNTHFDTNLLENRKIYYRITKKNKRPLMIDYFDSEHKKFYHGFDKYKGKKKYKIPFFIVYKY